MMKHVTVNRRAAWLALWLAAGGAASSPAAYVIAPNGQRMTGDDIRANNKGEITLIIGQSERIFLPGQYTQAMADEPAEYDQARQLIEDGKAAQAIPLLNNLVAKFKWLGWDVKATQLLAEVDVQQGNPAAAIKRCEQMQALYPALKDDADFQGAFYQGRIAAKQYDRVEPLLKSAIASGTRAQAARAQLQRGDLRLAQGRAEDAALDYLRTALLFETEKELHPEALYKAAVALRQLNDKSSFNLLLQKLKTLYPDSPYAKRAGANK